MHIAGHMQTDCTQTEKGQSCPKAAYEITANDCMLCLPVWLTGPGEREGERNEKAV